MSQRQASARAALKPGPVSVRQAAGHELRATLDFLTPVFGGGVRVDVDKDRRQMKEPDLVTPVRAPSLRGALREWWRRTCDRRLLVGELRAREAVLWGWASTQEAPARGWVSIAVDGSTLKRQVMPVLKKDHRERWQPDTPLAYAVFPLQPREGRGDLTAGTLSKWIGTFDVTLRAPPLALDTLARAQAAWPGVSEADLDRTLWGEIENAWLAWSTFGGFGARTRRGFGAVRQVKPAPLSLADVVSRLAWESRVAQRTPRRNDPQEAHRIALEVLRELRQGPGVGRDSPVEGGKRPGRSRWPEPDEIRRQTGAHDHRPIHPIRKFPRAAFGMPIVFHFKGEPGGSPPPRDHRLEPRSATRLASPLVLRPIADGGQFRAVALRLPTRDDLDAVIDDVHLVPERGPSPPVSGNLTAAEAGLVRPLGGAPTPTVAARSGADAVLDRFLEIFRSKP